MQQIADKHTTDTEYMFPIINKDGNADDIEQIKLSRHNVAYNLRSIGKQYKFSVSPTIAMTKDLWRKIMDEVSVSEVKSIENSVKRLQEATPDQLIGISTGFEKFDDILGGFVEGTLVTIGGRTGMGKTAFAFNLLKNLSVDKKIPSLYISLESTEQMCINTLIACILGIKYRTLLSGQLVAEEWEKLDNGLSTITDAHLFCTLQ